MAMLPAQPVWRWWMQFLLLAASLNKAKINKGREGLVWFLFLKNLYIWLGIGDQEKVRTGLKSVLNKLSLLLEYGYRQKYLLSNNNKTSIQVCTPQLFIIWDYRIDTYLSNM